MRDAYGFIEDVQEHRRHDFDDAYGEWFDERFELLTPPSYPEGAQTFRGRAGLKRWIAATQEIWGEWRLMAERFLVAGDQVVVLVRVIAQGHLSGVRLDRETGHIWNIADGRRDALRSLPRPRGGAPHGGRFGGRSRGHEYNVR